MFEELIASAEIWYCLTCRRCSKICPNLVKPETLVRYARSAAVRCGVVSYETACAYYDLFKRFQRVRWHAVHHCLHRDDKPISDARWYTWLNTPIPESTTIISSPSIYKSNQSFRQAANSTDMSRCFTCGECSSACPVAAWAGWAKRQTLRSDADRGAATMYLAPDCGAGLRRICRPVGARR